MVEWLGRWGSSAIRAYIEDARALAPEASRLAMQVAAPGQAAARAGPPTTTADLQLELGTLRPHVGETLWHDFGARSDSFSVVRPRGGKQHLMLAQPAGGAGSQRTVALCGWSFGDGPPGSVEHLEQDQLKRGLLCLRCLRSARQLGLRITDGRASTGASVSTPGSDQASRLECDSG